MLRNMLNEAKNVFQRIISKEQASDILLGCPSTDQAHRSRRVNAMSMMTGGRGFRTVAKAPRIKADGTTRGQRKRASRELAMSRVSENRAPKFMHSSARKRMFDVNNNMRVAA